MATFKQNEKFGRLGNQLFQIAATYAQSLRMNEEFSLPKWSYAKFFKNFKSEPIKNIRYIDYKESAFEYKELPKVNNLNLFGYYQSIKYFDNYQDEVKNLFNIELDRIEACAIHVRRGDYTTKPDYHTNLDLQYYQRALKYIKSKNIIVFSDDINYCKQLFSAYNFKYSQGSELEDFKLMTSCSEHIIANSSFSWWTSYLSNSETVIAPKTWFGKFFKGVWKDIYRKEMIIL